MAEELDLNIKIGANTQDLQSGLTQATTAVNNFGSQVSKVAKPTADATQSLVNLSRIAQDAPYGFMGIANNINPMLESFQRLQKESGSTTSALKSMVAGLSGPAGVGVAVGVLTSVIVAFGPKIADFISQTTDAEKAQKKMRDALAESTGAADAEKVKLEALLSIVNNVNNSTKEREAALNKLKEQYKGNLELQKTDINDGEKLIQVVKNITDAILRKAQVEAFAKLIAEEQAKQVRLQISTINEQVSSLSLLDKVSATISGSLKGMAGSASGAGIAMNLINDGVKKNQQEIKTSTDIVDLFTKKIQDLTKAQIDNSDAGNLSNSAAKTAKSAKEKLSKIDPNYENLEGFSAMESKMAQERRDLFGNKMGANIIGDTFGEEGKPQSKESFKSGQKEMDEFFKKNKEHFKELNKDAKEFAMTIADTATNSVMNLWSALEQGQSVGDALSNMFMDLAKQIAAAAIKAAIFQAILAAITGGGSIAAGGAGGGFMSMFSGMLGLADGGVVTKPTLAMVGEGNEHEAVMPLSKLGNMMNNTFNAGAMAGNGNAGGGQFTLKGSDLVLALNRSNYSLNLRRGA